MSHVDKAFLHENKDDQWHAEIKTCYGNRFQFLEVYEGEDGKAYWLERLNALGVPVEIIPYRKKGIS